MRIQTNILSFKLLLLNLILISSATAFIIGSAIRCLNEGEDVKVSFLYKDPSRNPIKCKCLNQEVVCKNPSPSKCTHNGNVYRSGETWKNGTCNKCSCSAGDVRCHFESCDPSLKCPINTRLIHRTGDCCPSCVEKDGECSLTGRKSFSLTSFDRKSTSFEAVCNYVMVRDCIGKSFSVHLLHEMPTNETTTTDKTVDKVRDAVEAGAGAAPGTTVADRIMSVVVKVDQTKVRLSRGPLASDNWHIRVGRSPSAIPFIKLGVLSVVKAKSGILIRTSLGLKITWDGRHDLRISLPSKFREKVCGLCGNFNADPEDDHTTKRGKKVSDVERFINSWKVGKRGICAEQTGVGASKTASDLMPESSKASNDVCSLNWKKRVEAMTVCNVLKATTFAACHRAVPITNSYKECVADVCSCTGLDCHCKSAISYINQCRRIGFQMNEAISNWKTLTSCETHPLNGSQSLVLQDTTGEKGRVKEDRKMIPRQGECLGGSIYRSCVSPCKRSCFKRKACNKVTCQPGCDCPPHLVWHESRCIKPSFCPSRIRGKPSFGLRQLLS